MVLAEFDPIPKVEELDFGAIRPAQDWRYWELRLSLGFDESADSLVGSAGELRRDELAPKTLQALEALDLNTGFAECGYSLTRHSSSASGEAINVPSFDKLAPRAAADLVPCFKFIAAVDAAGTVMTFDTREDLTAFFGAVDSREKAVILLDAHGFTWPDDGGHGIRQRRDGWEAVVMELVEICAPIQTDRVVVTISVDGELGLGRREVWSQSGACI